MRIIIIVFFSLFSSLAPVYSHAQDSQTEQMMGDVHEMAAWTQYYSAIMGDMILLFEHESINAALQAIESDDTEMLKKSVRSYGENRATILGSMKNLIAELPPVPEMTALKAQERSATKKLIGMMEVMKDTLDVTYNESAVASGHVETMLRRMSKDDYSGIIEIAKQQNLAMIRLLESENMQFEAAKVSMKKDNPNHAFQSIMLAQNNISIEELKLSNLALLESTRLEDRTEFNLRIKAELDKITPLIRAGRKSMENTLKILIKAKNASKGIEQKAFFDSAMKALETFEQSFEIEAKIHKWAMESYNLYNSDVLSDEYEMDIEANDEKIVALVLERFNVSNERIAHLTK